MTIKRLKTLIDKMPDNARVLVPGPDHSYREAEASEETAMYEGRGAWAEDFGEEMTPEAECGKRLAALIVR